MQLTYLCTNLTGASGFCALVLLATFALAGCSYFQSDVQRGYSENPHWKERSSVNVSYTTADVRLVTEREHPVLGNPILCSEPSPDVAKALTTASQISANLGKATTSAELGVAGGSAEAVNQLAGRTTALLALRDVVYRACEAYANGSLGADAYTLVTAKYGQLLSTLFLAQDMTGVVGPSGDSGAASSPINLGSGLSLSPSNGNGSSSGAAPKGGATQGPGKPNTGGTSNTTGTVTAGTPTAPEKPSSGGTANPVGTPSTPAPDAAATPTTTGTPGTAGNPPKGSPSSTGAPATTGTPSIATPKSAGAANSNGSPTNSEASAAVPSGATTALVRMNEDFLDLDLNLPEIMFVACMNEYDQTRLQMSKRKESLTNPWLRQLCDKLNSVDALRVAVQGYVEIAQKSGHPGPPVDPVAHASMASSNVSGISSSAASQTKIILAAQKALKAANCYTATPTGKEDSTTDTAAQCYQEKQGLKATGVLDMETLVALKAIGSP